MKKTVFNVIVIVSFICCSMHVKGQRFLPDGNYFIMTGPTLHVNIGSDDNNISIGWETSYWPNLNILPVGVDAGIEYEFKTNKVRLYTEGEAGLVLIGLAAGPVIEFAKEKPVAFGFQGSLWVAFFVGANLRYRYVDEHIFAPGAFIKFPLHVGEVF